MFMEINKILNKLLVNIGAVSEIKLSEYQPNIVWPFHCELLQPLRDWKPALRQTIKNSGR